MSFGDKVVLNFVVDLAYRTNDGFRKGIYQEYEYESKKYRDQSSLITIRRKIGGYLQIYQYGNPISFNIKRAALNMLQSQLERADKWFDPKSKVFSVNKEGEMLLTRDDRVTIVLAYGNTIALEPIIYETREYEKMMGSRMLLNAEDNYVDFSVETFKEFLNIVQRIDYYQAALSVINSVQAKGFQVAEKVSNENEANVKSVAFRKEGGENFFSKIFKNE